MEKHIQGLEKMSKGTLFWSILHLVLIQPDEMEAAGVLGRCEQIVIGVDFLGR